MVNEKIYMYTNIHNDNLSKSVSTCGLTICKTLKYTYIDVRVFIHKFAGNGKY